MIALIGPFMIGMGVLASGYFALSLFGGLAEMALGLVVLVVGVPIVWWRGRRQQREAAARWRLDARGMPYYVEYDHNGIEILQ